MSLCRKLILLLFLFTMFIFTAGCAVKPLTYNAALPLIRGSLFEYPSFDGQVTGVAVSAGGRVFVSFPRWGKESRYGVAELKPDGSLTPYPDAFWNRPAKSGEKDADTHFLSVQGIFIDSRDVLWVLDAPSPYDQGALPGKAKLVGVDLGGDRINRVIPLDEAVAPVASFLRNVCVDRWEGTAYISDAGSGAIIVIDLDSGHGRRVLADHFSTKAEPGVVLKVAGKELRDEAGKPLRLHVDGIALDADNGFLYYHALTGRTLYRIKTRYLNDPMFSGKEMGEHVERLAQTGAADGIAMDEGDNLYLTAPEENAVMRYRVFDRSLETLVRNDAIVWPGGICIAPDEFLYFTDSQFNLMPQFNSGRDMRNAPFKLFKVPRILMPGA
ncbi:MAG TPA: L-dopachrome tautomerase-related protein [Geobacteraceae bacterium]